MKRIASATCATVAVLLITLVAQQPTFRSSVDFVELDVFVTAGRGAFVKDLTAADFEILDDDRPQTISSFSLVDLPLPPASPPSSSKIPESDVTTNAGRNDERLWVMLLDAPDQNRGPEYTRRTQNVAPGLRRVDRTERFNGDHPRTGLTTRVAAADHEPSAFVRIDRAIQSGGWKHSAGYRSRGTHAYPDHL